MSIEIKTCNYVFIHGKKKGQVCGNKIRIKGEKCCYHKLCKHNRLHKTCKQCGKKNEICKHGITRSFCKKCGGSLICKHGKSKYSCKKCNGSMFCKHGKRKTLCSECGGGSLCEHGKRREICKDCKGGSVCEHNKIVWYCSVCDVVGHLSHNVRTSIRDVLHDKKRFTSFEYLCCSPKKFKKHIESQFEEGMTWENHGEWHIDHIIPLKYRQPSLKEMVKRLHYTNTQPMWATENQSKGNRYTGKHKRKQVKKKYSGSKSNKK